eukprot:5234581-Amphidinium_carterae.1
MDEADEVKLGRHVPSAAGRPPNKVLSFCSSLRAVSSTSCLWHCWSASLNGREPRMSCRPTMKLGYLKKRWTRQGMCAHEKIDPRIVPSRKEEGAQANKIKQRVMGLLVKDEKKDAASQTHKPTPVGQKHKGLVKATWSLVVHDQCALTSLP